MRLAIIENRSSSVTCCSVSRRYRLPNPQKWFADDSGSAAADASKGSHVILPKGASGSSSEIEAPSSTSGQDEMGDHIMASVLGNEIRAAVNGSKSG
ncbi:hypothetical protein [Mesorhizobium sp.]|uniref:hypothetical protein n=1 Tax=Mesorhizobium sp. TaxID=1871066 RepID=UPI0012200247|nr:hypothetical protein [Mesorhizobium sp.]TIL33920.1 MAG: hypothetical protein E5Y85_12065 [Mesorhizobium sp.]